MNSQSELDKNIKFLAKSEIRLKILSELSDHPDNVRGIVNKTNITYSSVSSNMSKLEHNNHIKKIKNKYHVNPMTVIYFKTLMDFKNSIELITNYNSFWAKHNIKQLNLESIKSLTDLEDSELIETTPLDIYRTHNVIKEQLVKSTSVKAIFPYLHPDYPQIIEDILKNKGNVELIIPNDINHAMMEQINEKIRRTSIKEKRLKITPVKTDLKIYLTVSDESMSLGLFKNDDSYDQNRILISENEKSKNWALNLFENIKGGIK